MPVVWSGALDPLDQIQRVLGFVLVSLLLQWMERRATRAAAVSFNKVAFPGHLGMRCIVVFKPLPAGREGEGRRQLSGFCSASSRWCGVSLLHLGVNHMVDKLATMISGRGGDHSVRSYVSAFATSCVEALTGDSRWSSDSSRRQVVRPRRCQGRRRWSLARGGEDQGSDCVFASFSKVLFVKFQVCFVFLVSLGSDCNMYPPTN